MKKLSFKYKILSVVLVIAFTFQSLHSINSHTYTTGFANFHSACPPFACCMGCSGPVNHMAYTCGKAYDCNEYLYSSK